MEDANDKLQNIDANYFQICFICTAFNLYPYNTLIVFSFYFKHKIPNGKYTPYIVGEVVLHFYCQDRDIYNCIYNWTAPRSTEISCRLSGVFIHITEEGKMNSLLFAPQTNENMINENLEMCLPLKKVTQILFKAI